jgi:hypothetical protein
VVGARTEPVHERLELASCQAPTVDDAAPSVGHGHFEDILCEIHRHRRGIQVGLLLVTWYDPPCTAMMPRRNREESIPSLEPTAGS